MIRLIGMRRAVILAAAAAANVVVAGAWLLGVEPLKSDAEGELAGVNSRISRLSGDIQNVKTVLAAYKDDYAKYQALRERGFVGAQNRFQAGRALEDMRLRAGLIGYTYRIDMMKTVPDTNADTAGAQLLSSRVTLEKLSSVLDNNVYGLLDRLAAEFPAHTRVERLEVKRMHAVDANILKALTQSPVPLVEGSVALDWFTVSPKEEAPANGAQQPPAGGFRGR
jgi:hypothetical protein